MLKKTHLIYKFISSVLLILACFVNVNGQVDWEDYPIWENTTKYSKIYVVNKDHKLANDTNRGTEKYPLLTIEEAVKRVKPGEKVLIHKGVYREKLEPVLGGIGPNQMISFESAEGEEVIIKGSEIIECDWVQELKVGKREDQPSITDSRSKKLWMTTLDDKFFEHGYFPFKQPNLEIEDYKPSPWSETLQNVFPCSLKRGMIYQNGQRMIQLNHYGDLIHVPGSFWVDTDLKTIHIHPFGSTNPNEEKFEFTVLGHLLKPQSSGLNYIQVKGLVFEHCANGFLPGGNGAVTTNGGHHWIFENNMIREVNSYGLEFGSYHITLESTEQDTSINEIVEPVYGFVNVRNNKIYACGTAGIVSSDIRDCIIKNNEIMFIGWQEAEHYGACAGIKLNMADHCLVSNNHIHHLLGCAGIWLQIGNQFSRVTRNIIDDLATFQGGIVVEASWKENMIDNNFVWNIEGMGIQGDYSENQNYYHNLIAYISKAVMKITEPKRITLDSIRLNARKNDVMNNMLIDFAERMDMSTTANEVGNNLFVFNTELGTLELKGWQERLIGKWGVIMRADVGFNPNTKVFKWTCKNEIKPVPTIPVITTDIEDESRNPSTTIPGPFRTLLSNCDYYVSMKVE